MAKLTPNILYDDLGDSCQVAEYHAAWVMESSELVSYLAISDFRPEQCGSSVLRIPSFEDVEALAGGLPMLSWRSYRIGCEQGIIVVEAAVIDSFACTKGDRRYRWVVTLESSIAVGISEVPRKVVDSFLVGDRSALEQIDDRSPLVQAKPSLLSRRR